MKSKHESNTINTLKKSFHSLGHRFTNQRESIWRLFNNTTNGLTITEAADVLKKKGIGHATVYRTVKTMQKLGWLHRVHQESGEHRFVVRHQPHSHMLVCRSCGRLVEFASCDLSILERLLEVETGFQIKGHDLEFFGVCPQCRPSN